MLNITIERTPEETIICLHLPPSETSTELRTFASLLGRSAIRLQLARSRKQALDSNGAPPSLLPSLEGPVAVQDLAPRVSRPDDEPEALLPRRLQQLMQQNLRDFLGFMDRAEPGILPLTPTGTPPPSPDAGVEAFRQRVQKRAGKGVADIIAGASRGVANALGLPEETISETLAALSGKSVQEVHAALLVPLLGNPLTGSAAAILLSEEAKIDPVGVRRALLLGGATLAELPAAVVRALRAMRPRFLEFTRR